MVHWKLRRRFSRWERLRPYASSWLVAAVAAILVVSPIHADNARMRERWVGSWAAAPQPFMPGALETFRNQSVRLIVHTSIGGTKIRIRISNIYADRPLILGAAHVALVKSGPDIDPATDRALTFDGKAATTVAAGQTAQSDPLELDVPAAAALAITFFFPQETSATTSHFLALQTSYVSRQAGNATETERFPVERTIDSWPFLTGIDVAAPVRVTAIVAFGDSTVDGDGSTANANRRWPDLLATRLQQSDEGKLLGVLNEGIIGNRLLQGSPHEPPSEFGDALGEAGVARFARDALGQAGVSHVIVRIGVNDLGFPGAFLSGAAPVTAQSVIDGYRKLIAQARRARVRIIGTTITPFEGATTAAGFYTPEKEQVRQQINAWLRTERDFDGFIDLDRVLRDPDHPIRLLPAYDSGDHLHPNDAGYAASANAVAPSLFGIM